MNTLYATGGRSLPDKTVKAPPVEDRARHARFLDRQEIRQAAIDRNNARIIDSRDKTLFKTGKQKRAGFYARPSGVFGDGSPAHYIDDNQAA